MKRIDRFWNWRTVLGGLLVAGAVMAAAQAGWFGLGGESWEEEVRLHDGRTMLVKRFRAYGGYPELASRDRRVLDEKWVFKNSSSGKTVIWKSDFRHAPEGDNLMLVLLDFKDGIPYVATTPAGCLAYNYWGRPNPPYIFFKYDEKTWRRISIAEFPAEFKNSNVVIGTPSEPDRTGLLSVEVVKQQHAAMAPEYQTILREPLPAGSYGSLVNCEELVYYKGYWVGPGDSIGKRMADRMSK